MAEALEAAPAWSGSDSDSESGSEIPDGDFLTLNQVRARLIGLARSLKPLAVVAPPAEPAELEDVNMLRRRVKEAGDLVCGLRTVIEGLHEVEVSLREDVDNAQSKQDHYYREIMRLRDEDFDQKFNGPIDGFLTPLDQNEAADFNPDRINSSMLFFRWEFMTDLATRSKFRAPLVAALEGLDEAERKGRLWPFHCKRFEGLSTAGTEAMCVWKIVLDEVSKAQIRAEFRIWIDVYRAVRDGGVDKEAALEAACEHLSANRADVA